MGVIMEPVALVDPKELGSLSCRARHSAKLVAAKSLYLGGSVNSTDAPPVPEGREATGKTATPWRVLIVDDDVGSVWTLAALLELHGHEVRTALDGESALRIAESFQPDLVTLDLAMPEKDGYEVCRRLRSTISGRRMVIAALTGYGQQSDRRRSRIAGFDIHLLKPIDLSELDRIFAHWRPRAH